MVTKLECVVCDFGVIPENEEEKQSFLENWKLCKKHTEDIMQTEFPKSTNKFLKAEMFQDQQIPLTFVGWDKKANEDSEYQGKTISWKEKLKYQLRYSYPEFAIDEIGEKRLGKDGNPFLNKNYDPKFPKGYSIVYHFDEGVLETGSLPLFEAFCMVRPSKGDKVLISRTGKDKETKWKVIKSNGNSASTSELPDIQLEEENPF